MLYKKYMNCNHEWDYSMECKPLDGYKVCNKCKLRLGLCLEITGDRWLDPDWLIRKAVPMKHWPKKDFFFEFTQ